MASENSIRTLNHFIAGEFAAPRAGRYLENRAPATNRVVAQVGAGDAEDVDAAVLAARSAFEEGWATSVAERADLCEAVADAIEARAEEFAAWESLDTGKPRSLAAQVDIPRAVANFRFFAGAVRHDQTGCHPMEGALNYTLRSPLGVVALITPWNLPLYLLSWKTAPALAMGNTVVAKPSELTPMTAHGLAEVFHELGAPPGVFNLVQGYGAEAGQALVEHPAVAAVSFTGGTATGQRVAATAGPQFKKLSLELGGKNPTVVFADCDFERAVEGAVRAGFLNQGQVCLCGSRILVEEAIYERFVEALVARVQAMEVGNPEQDGIALGSLISQEHRAKVESYLELAQQEGGTIRCGGVRPQLSAPYDQGAFLEPAVITGLDSGCRTATEEIFGPIVTVHAFRDEAEALKRANEVRYGLSASVWTQDLNKAHRVSAQLETGMVWVNTWLLRDLRVPFGGIKDSGVGREGGFHSLEFFSEARNVCVYLGS